LSTVGGQHGEEGRSRRDAGMSGNPEIHIGKHAVGPGSPVFVVAELSGNHGGSFERALGLVRAAAEAGADAVKLQTYTADTITLECSREFFRLDSGETLHELYSRNATPWEWQPKLKDAAEKLGMECFSAPFDPTAVDFLETMEVPAYKIASFELVDLPLIRKVAATGKPLILSTGMATLGEIEEAVATAHSAGCDQIVLLKCTSTYPAVPEEMNLRTIPHLTEAFGVPVGLSDHSRGIAVPVAAVALGAVMIEKHLTLSRGDGGAESGFALEPDEFKSMVDAVRTAETALGTVSYGLTQHEESSRIFRRSLFVVEDMKAGEEFTTRNVRSIRPGQGLAPKHLGEIVGRKADRDIVRGTPLSWDLIG